MNTLNTNEDFVVLVKPEEMSDMELDSLKGGGCGIFNCTIYVPSDKNM